MKNELQVSGFQRFLMKNVVAQFIKFTANTIKILYAVKKAV